MEVEISSNVQFFKLYMRGREARSWGKIGAFRFFGLQSTAEIFLAPDHTGGVLSASMTRVDVDVHGIRTPSLLH
jgi:hypothetical protein